MRALRLSTIELLLLFLLLGHQVVDVNATPSFRGKTTTNHNSTSTTTTTRLHHRRLCSAQSTCSNGACCSVWGFCGYSDAHCGSDCVSGCPSSPPPSTQPPPIIPTQPPVNINDNNDNKITNGDFEEGLYPWYPNSNVGITLQLDSATYHSGSQSVLVTGRSTGTWNGVEQNILSTNNGATGVLPNERYYMSTYVKLKDVVTPFPQTVRITIRIKGGNNGVEDWIGISQLVTNNEWTLVQGELTISTNNVIGLPWRVNY